MIAHPAGRLPAPKDGMRVAKALHENLLCIAGEASASGGIRGDVLDRTIDAVVTPNVGTHQAQLDVAIILVGTSADRAI